MSRTYNPEASMQEWHGSLLERIIELLEEKHTPKVYGVWFEDFNNGAWYQRVDGSLITTTTMQEAAALNLTNGSKGVACEIGIDGKPVEVQS